MVQGLEFGVEPPRFQPVLNFGIWGQGDSRECAGNGPVSTPPRVDMIWGSIVLGISVLVVRVKCVGSGDGPLSIE